MDVPQILEAMDQPGRLPIEAIQAARADRAAMVPVLLNEIQTFPTFDGTRRGRQRLFFAFHLLGEWQEKSAYRPLARFLRLPSDFLEDILGDAKTETTHRVMAAVFDGDPAPLHDIIRDSAADEYIRSRMLDTIAMLTMSGQLARVPTGQFLRDCYDQLEPRHDCFVWNGWVDAVAWLGFAELKPLVRQGFETGLIDSGWLSYEDFEQDLQHAIDHPDVEPLHPDGHLTVFGDTIEELSDWAGFQPRSARGEAVVQRRSSTPGLPERNPFRNVGRNDPCPCGSGKKFKKCCLTRTSSP